MNISTTLISIKNYQLKIKRNLYYVCNMKKLLLLYLLAISFSTLCAQRIEYKSRVYDGINFAPIQGASIYNYNTKEYAFSDKNGTFIIHAQKNDTIIISKSIYKQYIFIISKEEIMNQIEEYYLYYKAILLKAVDVRALNPSYEGFKRDIVNLQVPELMDIRLSEWEKMNIEYTEKGANVLKNTKLASPITLLYNMFSKKAKSQRLYYELVQSQDEIDRLPEKYNREIVSKITGLQGDEVLDFMMFCRFGYYDLIRWSDREIIRQIETKYYDYAYFKALQE